jgi:hypothetical protein
MSRFTDQNAVTGGSVGEERVRRVEDQLNYLELTLPTTFVQGRLRTDRNAPTSSSDIETGDQLYDIVQTVTYQYTLLNNAGTLNWVRIICSTF